MIWVVEYGFFHINIKTIYQRWDIRSSYSPYVPRVQYSTGNSRIPVPNPVRVANQVEKQRCAYVRHRVTALVFQHVSRNIVCVCVYF